MVLSTPRVCGKALPENVGLAPSDKQDGESQRGGVLLVNISARDKWLLERACRTIRSVFRRVLVSSPSDDSINVVVVAGSCWVLRTKCY